MESSTITGGADVYPSMMDKGQQRNYADNYVASAINNVGITSGDKYYSWLKDQGAGVTRDVARSAWNEYNKLVGYIDVINKWPPDRAIPRAWYQSTDAKGITAYGYRLNYTLMDKQSGDSYTHTFFVNSDTRLTTNQVRAKLEQTLEVYNMQQDFQVVDAYIDSIYHNAGAKW